MNQNTLPDLFSRNLRVLSLAAVASFAGCGGGGSGDSSGTAPTATSSAVLTSEDVAVSGTLSATDPQADPLTFKVVSNGTLGTASITNATAGSFTYTPKLDAFGTDSFTFNASDGNSTSNTATVTVTIVGAEDPPVATPGNLTTNEDVPASGTLIARDPDGDPLTFRIVAQPNKGSVTITNTASGAFTYTPNLNAFGSDVFTFATTDGVSDSNTATLSVTINAVNDAPVATAGCKFTPQAKTLDWTLSASDPDSTALLYRLADGSTGPFITAKGGTVTITDDTTGAFSYQPLSNGDRGADSFGYRVTDPEGAVGTATQTVIVEQTVMPLGDSITQGSMTVVPALTAATWVGYRQDLYLALVASGVTTDFVGSLDYGYSALPAFDTNNEGHGGWTAAEIAYGRTTTISGDDGVFAWLNANPADFILLHAGTNQLDASTDLDIKAILDEINRWEISANGNPVTVLLALIIDQNPINPDVTTVNDKLLTLANNRIAAGDRLIVVDQHGALIYPDDLSDSLHPNTTGYGKMADAWFEKLQPLLDKCP